MAKQKYLKLGRKASIFWDPITRLKVTKGSVVAVSTRAIKRNEKLQSAINNLHLVEATEEEYKKANADAPVVEVEETEEVVEDTLEQKLESMKMAELVEYAEENYELDEDDVAEMKAVKKKADLVEFILALETESEEEEA